MRILNLDQLKRGTPGITEVVGAYLAQATSFFLEEHGHKSGVIIEVSGLFKENFQVIWSDKVDERVRRSWRDNIEATEYAAVGIAALLTESLLNLSIVERSYIGTYVDYILGEMNADKYSFLQKAKLEVSGIGKETPKNTVKQRIKVKLKQVQKSSSKELPSYVIVVEFGKPKAKIVKDETTI